MKFAPRRLIRLYYLKFIRLQGDPKQIARGFAVGTFIGVTPTIPLHTISLLILTPLLRGNIVAAFLASVVFCNPLTYLPQYYLSWLIGNWLTPKDLSWERIRSVMDIVFSDAGFTSKFSSLSSLGLETITVLLVGGVILAAPIALISYVASLKFFRALREKRLKKHILD